MTDILEEWTCQTSNSEPCTVREQGRKLCEEISHYGEAFNRLHLIIDAQEALQPIHCPLPGLKMLCTMCPSSYGHLVLRMLMLFSSNCRNSLAIYIYIHLRQLTDYSTSTWTVCRPSWERYMIPYNVPIVSPLIKPLFGDAEIWREGKEDAGADNPKRVGLFCCDIWSKRQPCPGSSGPWISQRSQPDYRMV